MIIIIIIIIIIPMELMSNDIIDYFAKVYYQY